MRGRDIKQYSYEFADLYVITTFPSYKIDIDQYPSIKQHLMSFGYDRLKQTGNVGSRKKTNNQWFETQDTIGYWEDFYSEKMIYPNMTKFLPFYLDNKAFMLNDKSFMITGESVAYLTAFFNSSLFKYCFIDDFPELQGGTREIRKIFLSKIPVLKVSSEVNSNFKILIDKIQEKKLAFEDTKEYEIIVDNLIFDLYSLTENQKKEIGFIEIQ